ncbi:reverse transcriptase domain-containing protein [Tanacetum coccineum]
MLIFSRTRLFLWAEAIATACYTQNRFIIHCRFNKTPYELINGRKPDISFLHVFGALCYPKNDREDIGKLGTKGSLEDIPRLNTSKSNTYAIKNASLKKKINNQVLCTKILNINYFCHFLDILRNYDPMDDEPMWAADHVVAPTPGLMITIPETRNEFAIKAYQLLKDKVLLKLDWAKTQKTKPSLKKTVAFADEGNSNSDTDKIIARMDVMTLKMDAQYKEHQSNAKKTKPDLDEDDIPMSREEEAKFMQTFHKTRFYNDYRDRDSNRDNCRSSGQMFMDLKTQLETVAKNHQASIQNLEKQSGRPSGSLPSNTQPNPKGHNAKAYQPPQSRNEHVNVVFTRSGKSYNPPVNQNDQQNDSETPINFDSDDEDEEPTPQPNLKPVKET